MRDELDSSGLKRRRGLLTQVGMALRQFTVGQVSRLLGLCIFQLKDMRRTGAGPIYTGVGEYVSYREDHVKQ